MIVKDEARIIRRCIDRALSLIDYALIVDTGSTDDTIAEIRRCLSEVGVAGEVIEEPWRDFAFNRSNALAHLRRHADIDYALMIDADDAVDLPFGLDVAATKAALSADVYNLETRLGAYSYLRPQLISNRKPFFFRGVLHEFLACDESFSQATLPGVAVHAIQDSARNRLSDKFRRDAATLEAALATETDAALRTRYTFYLAQSWRDCGELANAKERYIERAGLGGWDQEIYISLYCAAQLTEALGQPFAEAMDLYLRAYETCPARAEALHGAARLCRLQQRWRTGYLLAARARDIVRPNNGLFIAEWIYRYGALDELAVAAYWCGRADECLVACERLLAMPDLPASERPRIIENSRLARVALSQPGQS